MSASLFIRQFILAEDYNTVCDLWEKAGPGIQLRRSDSQDEIAKKLQRDADLFLVAECNGEIIGSVLGGYDGRRGMVYHLAVAREYRNRGVGTALMDTLEIRLRAKGCLRYYLLVTKDNSEAREFYEKYGWKQLDLFVYGKDLDIQE